jgi:hypothetical protein
MKEAVSPGKGETGLTFSAFYYDDYSDLGEFLRFSKSVIFCLIFRWSWAGILPQGIELP